MTFAKWGLVCKKRWAEVTLALLGLGAMAASTACFFRPTAIPEPVQGGRPLRAWVSDLSGPNREGARKVINNFGPAAIRFLLQKVEREGFTEHETFLALASGGTTSLPQLLDCLTRPNVELRLCAVHAMGVIGPEIGAETRLVAQTLGNTASHDPNGLVRFGAVVALGRLRSADEIVPLLVGALHSETFENAFETPLVRREAAYQLGKLGPRARAAVPELLNMAQDADPAIREAARQALHSIHGRPARECMVSNSCPQ